MHFFNIILGLIMLIFGRKLFWLFVGIVGFLAGMKFAGMLFADQSPWMLILGGLAAGVIGALLAAFFQRLAFALGGFFGGAYFALIVAQPLGIAEHSMLLAVVGGGIGAIVAILLMDWAIIVISCLVGAGTIVPQLGFRQSKSAIIFVVLVIIGIFVQEKLMERTREHKE